MSDATHGTPFQAPEVEEVARLFPSYEILGLIACGGMGAVYHAIQTSLDRAVAIKILPREFSTDAEFRQGFEAEAKAMAKLNHPNLIGVFDFGEVDGMLYIVMEYVAGKSLHQVAQGSALEQADALGMVIGVCHGLAHAHEYGILHRDIKPSNILLDGQGNPKIGDFGLARALEREIQEGEQIFGTPGYTAPEVLEPPFTIDQRADVFSVGVMLHELLTGHLPGTDPRPASQICQCNPRLDAVIQRATYPDPAYRYATASELAKELEKIAAIPVRTLRTGSASAARGSGALRPPGTASSLPVRRPAAAPQGAFQKRRPVVKQSSGSGTVVFLLIAIAVAATVLFFLKGPGRKTAAPPPAPAPPAAPAPAPPVVAGTEPSAPETAAQESPEEILRSARTSIRRRVAPAIESYKRDMKANLHGFRDAVETAAQEIPGEDRRRVTEALSENLALWENDGYRLPQSLPPGFMALQGVAALHAGHLEKQSAIQGRLETGISSYSGIYVLELQDRLGQLEKDGNTRAADAVEQEIDAVGENPGRFRALMLE